MIDQPPVPSVAVPEQLALISDVVSGIRGHCAAMPDTGAQIVVNQALRNLHGAVEGLRRDLEDEAEQAAAELEKEAKAKRARAWRTDCRGGKL